MNDNDDLGPSHVDNIRSLIDFRRKLETETERKCLASITQPLSVTADLVPGLQPGWQILGTASGTHVLAIVAADGTAVAYEFTTELLEKYGRWFLGRATARRHREEAEARADAGGCGYGYCDRKNWKHTGLCRACFEEILERARREMQHELTK